MGFFCRLAALLGIGAARAAEGEREREGEGEGEREREDEDEGEGENEDETASASASAPASASASASAPASASASASAPASAPASVSVFERDPVLVPIEDSIDLHTFQPRDVASVVEEYLHEAQRLGLREVRVIHGRGKGVQRRIVQGVLERHPAVESFAGAPASRGGWGATVVWLAARRGGRSRSKRR